jgi:hypothetical protein
MAKKKATKQKHAPRRAISASRQHRRLAKTAQPKKTGGGEVRRVDASLKRLRQAYRLATARSEDVLAVANSLGEVAVQKHTNSLIRDLCEKQFLRDLIALRDALAKCPIGTLNPQLESLRLLPDAIIQWLVERFGVAPFGRAGEELDLPASKLRNYACEFEPPSEPMALVKVQVIAPGWKRDNIILIPLRVKLSQQQAVIAGR